VVFCGTQYVHAKISPYKIIPEEYKISDSLALAAAELYLQDVERGCPDIPGSLPIPDEDSGCIHAIARFFPDNDTSEDFEKFTVDNLILNESSRAALWAYYNFRQVPESLDPVEIDHSEYLSIIREKKKPKTEYPFFIKPFYLAWRWIRHHIIHPIADFFLKLFSRSTGTFNFLVISAGILVLLALLALLARILIRLPRVQSALDIKDIHLAKAEPEPRWLEQAEKELAKAQPGMAVRSLYFWIIGHSTETGRIHRYEWWTNRQLIHAIETKWPHMKYLARSIIREYEDAEYGHMQLKLPKIKTLFREAVNKSRAGK
jgi:hypothetical protein